jgi:hypothetical protein
LIDDIIPFHVSQWHTSECTLRQQKLTRNRPKDNVLLDQYILRQLRDHAPAND